MKSSEAKAIALAKGVSAKAISDIEWEHSDYSFGKLDPDAATRRVHAFLALAGETEDSSPRAILDAAWKEAKMRDDDALARRLAVAENTLRRG